MKRLCVLVTLAATLGAACKKAPGTEPSAAGTGAAAIATAPAAKAASATESAAASDPTTAPPVPRASDPLAHPLFWAVEKAGTTTYFLGTMHAGVDAAHRLPAMVWSKLDAAPSFAMEADLDDPEAGSAIRPTQTSLRDVLGADYWARLEGALGEGTAKAVDHLPPMVPAAALSMRGLPSTPAMDKVLSSRAAGEHKPLVFLEPAARQLALLGKWMDVKALKMMLDELPTSEQHARAMLDAYVAGDESKMLALSDDERTDALHHGYTAAEYAQEMNDLLYDRNASWIPAIEKLHAGGGGFVAVGALHLIGPRSVLDLLAHKGYRVTRVSTTAPVGPAHDGP